MSYLIDTNIISEIRKGDHCHPQVAAWWQDASGSDLYLSALSIGEICKGIERVRPKNPQKAAMLEHWVEQVMVDFSDRVLAVTIGIAEEWGRISATRSISIIDALLAATAKVHGLMLVTRNEADMNNLGVEIFNPFKV